MNYIEQKQKEAREYMGFNRDHYANKGLDHLIETTIKDTLQTLLDSEELELTKDTDGKTYHAGHPDVIRDTAITAIRAKITKLMK